MSSRFSKDATADNDIDLRAEAVPNRTSEVDSRGMILRLWRVPPDQKNGAVPFVLRLPRSNV